MREQLVCNYADLIALALDQEQFYDPLRIRLGVLPGQQEQQAYISTFQRRLLATLKQGDDQRPYIGIVQAEQLVWQEIEADLLQEAYTTSVTPR